MHADYEESQIEESRYWNEGIPIDDPDLEFGRRPDLPKSIIGPRSPSHRLTFSEVLWR